LEEEADKSEQMKKVKTFTKRNGEQVFNLASTSANNDWIRSARLLKRGMVKEVQKLDSEPTYYLPAAIFRLIKKSRKT